MKKALSLMLALVLAFGVLVSVPVAELPLSISANAVSAGDFSFSLNTDGESYTLSGCNTSAQGNVVVPSQYNGLPVTVIGEKAFYNCKGISSVTISEGVTEISESAFNGCSEITAVDIPESVTSIERLAFSDCSKLESVVIPHEVKLISNCSFYGCENLESVKMLGNVQTIDSNAFKYCYKLKSIDIPDTVTAIGDSAFGYSGIVSMRLPENIKYINKATFNYCEELQFVSIPKSVVKVYSKAFLGCVNFEKVYFSGTSAQWDSISIGSYNAQLTAAQTHYDVEAAEITLHYEGAVTVEPTCVAEGEMQYTCPCGHSYTEVIPALGHDYTTDWFVESHPTCIAEGLKYHYCTRCAEKSDITAIAVDSDAHSYGDYITDAQPTCTVDGAKHQECEYCGAKSATEAIPATGHSFGDWIVTEATCTANGSKHKECATCGAKTESEVISATGHTASEWITDSSTQQHKECTVCGEILETVTTKKVESLSAPKLKSIANVIGGVKLSWDEVENAEGYIVYRKVKGGKWETLGKCAEASYTDKTAKSGTTYYYTVKAYYQNIKSACKGTLAIKFLDAPQLVSVTKASKGVNFTWSKVKGAGGYIVYRKVEGGSWVKVATTKGTSYVDKKAKSGVAYYYTAKAYNGKVKSAHYAGVAYVSLATPKIISISNSENGVAFSWGKVKGAEGYIVYRKVKGGKWETLGKCTETSYTDKTAKSGTTYYYTVRAYNGAIKSDYYGNYSVKCIATPKLSSISTTTNSIKLEWAKVSGAEKYRVYRKTETGKWEKVATVKTTSYTDKTAKKGVKYIYTVRAEGKGALSHYDENGVSAKIEVSEQAQKPAATKPNNQTNKPGNQNNKPGSQHNKPSANKPGKPNKPGKH